MCTVIVAVPHHPGAPVRLLAVRDEDPERSWDPPGAWWSEHDGVVGVRDRRAGGAWLAADTKNGKLSVILNRGEPVDSADPLLSRGSIVLRSVAGESVSETPQTATFNLVEVDHDEVVVTMWDGKQVRRERLEPGVHMIAHDDLDDANTPRIARWLGAFAEPIDALDESDADWMTGWIDVLRASSELGPEDDRAIIRDNRPHGFPTLSLLVCVAEVTDRVALRWEVLADPGHWQELTLPTH